MHATCWSIVIFIEACTKGGGGERGVDWTARVAQSILIFFQIERKRMKKRENYHLESFV